MKSVILGPYLSPKRLDTLNTLIYSPVYDVAAALPASKITGLHSSGTLLCIIGLFLSDKQMSTVV